MTPLRWAQIRQVFDSALERPEPDRAAYVRAHCKGDEELRKEVESLLASHDKSSQFLNTPAADVNLAFLSLDASSAGVPRVARVGPYQLDRRIGRGGMGSVWLASRVDQGFPRQVAVKMVKRGMDTAEILRRFRMERQVLAGLDHPNIARLIDAGSAPDGSPYLVMEYVEGIPIDQYCEGRQITISERLKLFRSVCAAVQYAHFKLVVHRDIKAGNILVTKEGTPKLLDFGIAKLMQSESDTSAPTETRPELRAMTLEYASPEQVRGEPITTASDVYSLGVLLYKLLTGRFPYSREDTKSRTSMEHAICEKEPPRASSVALTVPEMTVPLPTRKVDVAQEETLDKARRRLRRKLQGDLDTILLKALRKEPDRRYLSAEQFSDDIRRYLEGRPVQARDDRFGYRAAKFVTRNLVAICATAAALMLIVGGGLWFAVQARRAQEQLAEARNRDLALEPALIHANLLLGKYGDAIQSAREFLKMHPEQSPIHTNVRRDLATAELKLADSDAGNAVGLDTDAVAQLDMLSKQNGNGAEHQKDVILALRKLGFAQYSSGSLVAALTSFSRALRMAEALPADSELRLTAAQCNFEMGKVLEANREPEVAATSLRKALDLYRQLAGEQDTPVRDRSPAGFEQALEETAANAPAELRDEMTAEFSRMKR